ncbi:MAG: sugar phosphate isomerase/epimerase [Candidatus Dormibacteraeota bacterium]|nr:sugar phosphate isomerase/epimerase [Candidatus Dormibacteraeota bacterium]MBO0743777.1 sugar phosphate isomerase/epimerase [Candidatus Dormibacteraeota bacterium]
MFLSFSTWGMQRTPIEVAVDHCASLGYDGLELTVIPGWPTDAAGLDGPARRRIRRLYDDAGLQLCGLSGNTPLLRSPDGEDLESRLARFRRYLDLASELQLPGQRLTVSTTSGGSAGEWEEVREELVDRYGSLAAHAEAAGVIASAEPHVGSALHTPDGAKWLVEQVRSPALRVHFDISHFNVQGMDMENAVAELAPLSVHTHVKDERGVVPDYEFLIPGEGDMDYVRYLRAMDEAGYRGHITVEISLMVQRRGDYDALAAASQSYSVLQNAFTQAGVARGGLD